MSRAEFLAHVGEPQETRRRTAALREEARCLWDTIRPHLYRKDGKTPRAGTPSGEVEVTCRAVGRLYTEADDLARLAGRQQLAHDDPWSHTRADVLTAWGLQS